MGKNGPIVLEYTEPTSQPSAREPLPSGVRVHISFTVDALSTRRSSSTPSFTSIRHKRARSAAVENMPAWPATPLSARARGSWTSPCSRWPPKNSVGAMRSRLDAGGWNDVSFKPSGVKIVFSR
jgi:hypothetical protein